MTNLVPMEYNNQRIMTTKVLAEQYGTEETNIKNNFNNNKERFIEGKHYFQLKGDALKEFKRVVDNIVDPSIKFASVLTLWTERGAARHAKVLDTDEAWNVYEILEETYFRVRENVKVLEDKDSKTDKLNDAVVNLIDKMSGIIETQSKQLNKKDRQIEKQFKIIYDFMEKEISTKSAVVNLDDEELMGIDITPYINRESTYKVDNLKCRDMVLRMILSRRYSLEQIKNFIESQGEYCSTTSINRYRHGVVGME